jgi:hypothetical protein
MPTLFEHGTRDPGQNQPEVRRPARGGNLKSSIGLKGPPVPTVVGDARLGHDRSAVAAPTTWISAPSEDLNVYGGWPASRRSLPRSAALRNSRRISRDEVHGPLCPCAASKPEGDGGSCSLPGPRFLKGLRDRELGVHAGGVVAGEVADQFISSWRQREGDPA